MEAIVTVQCPVSANNLRFAEYNAFLGFLQTSHAPNNTFPKSTSAPKPELLAWPSLYKKSYLCHAVLANVAPWISLLGVFSYAVGKPDDSSGYWG